MNVSIAAREPVASKFVRVADEDDDRYADGRVPVNPRINLPQNSRGSGWHPPINRDVRSGVERYRDYRGCVGYFQVFLYGTSDVKDWRVSCLGGDNTGYERCQMIESTARRVFEEIKDFTTIRTLRLRHGFRHV